MPMSCRLSFVRGSAASRGRSQERMSATAVSYVSDLRARVERPGAPARPQPRPRPAVPRGFEAVPTPFGEALLREDVVPLPALDPYPGSVAYIDTETPGLGGGAGTYVFAAAVARPIDCGLRLSQLFLPQPGLEAAFLHRLREEIAGGEGVASFNGGSFDPPVLRTRGGMARMPGEAVLAPHVGLLPPVRARSPHPLENCPLLIGQATPLGCE